MTPPKAGTPPLSRGSLRALVLLLSVLLGVLTPTAAQAASIDTSDGSLIVGPDSMWGIATFNFGGIGPDTTCTVAVRYGNEALDLEMKNGQCRGSVDTSPGYVQIPEPGTWYTFIGAGFTVEDPLDAPCGFGSPDEPDGTLGAHPDDGWIVHSTVPGEDFIMDPSDGSEWRGCQLSTLCLDLYTDDGPGETNDVSCVDMTLLPLPEAPVTPGVCQYANITSGRFGRAYWNSTQDSLYATWNSGVSLPSGSWRMTAIVKDGAQIRMYKGGGQGVSFIGASGTDAASQWRSNWGDWVADSDKVIGVGVVLVGAQWTDQDGETTQRNALANETFTIGAELRHGAIGTQDPANCSFYFGEKWWDDGHSGGLDEPAGPMTTDPLPPPTVTDEPAPATTPTDENGTPADELSFWGKVLALLAATVAAIYMIPKAILSGLGAVLSALFVPTDAPSFHDVPNPLPAGWLPDFPDVSGSACGPLTMPRLQLGYKAMHVGPVTMLNTCDDPWPLARTFTYNGLLAGLLVTIMWRSYRAAASALGMAVDAPSGGGDDE